MIFRQLFDTESSTYTYLLADEATREAVLIDPVRERIDREVDLLAELDLTLTHVLETHVHADHVTAAGLLRERLGARTVVSRRAEAHCADIQVADGDTIHFGRHALEVRETPGHTAGCVTYVLDDHSMAFTGDALFVRGTGRTDFQGGDARTLYRSVHGRVFTLPDGCLVYPGHDYKGRTVSTVGEEKAYNPRLGGGRTEDDFARIMGDLQLAYPKKMAIAVPANRHCGLLGAEAGTGPSRPWAPVARSMFGVPELTAGWLSAHYGEFRLVDVRSPDEYHGPVGHIHGSELVPLHTLAHAAAEWDRSLPLLLVCHSGARSGQAALVLERGGFQRVASLAGGMAGLAVQGSPLVTTSRYAV